MGSRRNDGDRPGFRETVSRAINQVAMASLASCDERNQRKELFRNDEIVINDTDRAPYHQGGHESTEGGTNTGLLNEIYRRIGINAINGSGTSSKPKIWGTDAFDLKVRIENTDGVDGGLQLIADSGGLQCSWKRKFGEMVISTEHSGSVYHITADDIGAMIILEAHMDGIKGTAYAEFGPFEIDSSLRRQLVSILDTKGTDIPFDIISIEQKKDQGHSYAMQDTLQNTLSDNKTDKGLIEIRDSDIMIKRKSPTGRFSTEAQGVITSDYPEIEVRGHRHFALRLGVESTIRGLCSSRSQRDLLVLLIRVLNGYNLIGLTAMISLVTRQNALSLPGIELKHSVDTVTDTHLEPNLTTNLESGNISDILDVTYFAQRLNEVLSDTATKLNTSVIKSKKIASEREDLQEELGATISAYQSMVSGLHDEIDVLKADVKHKRMENSMSQSTMPVAPVIIRESRPQVCSPCHDKDAKLGDLQRVNEQYKKELEAIRLELRSMKDRYSQVLVASEKDRKTRNMSDMMSREELNLTKSEMFDYKRKIEEYQAKIKRLEKEKNDLQKSFLYTKEKLDELVRANKLLELDKTKMMDTTMRGNSEAENQIHALAAQVSALQTENEKLRGRVRLLAMVGED